MVQGRNHHRGRQLPSAAPDGGRCGDSRGPLTEDSARAASLESCEHGSIRRPAPVHGNAGRPAKCPQSDGGRGVNAKMGRHEEAGRRGAATLVPAPVSERPGRTRGKPTARRPDAARAEGGTGRPTAGVLRVSHIQLPAPGTPAGVGTRAFTASEGKQHALPGHEICAGLKKAH